LGFEPVVRPSVFEGDGATSPLARGARGQLSFRAWWAGNHSIAGSHRVAAVRTRRRLCRCSTPTRGGARPEAVYPATATLRACSTFGSNRRWVGRPPWTTLVGAACPGRGWLRPAFVSPAAVFTEAWGSLGARAAAQTCAVAARAGRMLPGGTVHDQGAGVDGTFVRVFSATGLYVLFLDEVGERPYGLGQDGSRQIDPEGYAGAGRQPSSFRARRPQIGRRAIRRPAAAGGHVGITAISGGGRSWGSMGPHHKDLL